MNQQPDELGRDEYREKMRPKAQALVDRWIARGERPSMSVDKILDGWWEAYANFNWQKNHAK